MNFSRVVVEKNDLPEEFNSPLQSLITIEQRLNHTSLFDSIMRQVNFMSYELTAICNHKSETEVLELLNYFFFQSKKFRIFSSPYFISQILSERKGCGIGIALLYSHLALSLGLKFDIIHWPLHTILKWDCNGRSSYINLENNGQFLNEDDLIEIINKYKDQVRTLSLTEALVQYINYISTDFKQNSQREVLLESLNMILRIEPENTRFLLERALLKKDMGHSKGALTDLKRYFAFTESTQIPVEIRVIYENLAAQEATV